MIVGFVVVLIVYAIALAAVCAWSTIRDRGPARWQLAWMLALEAGLIVQAVVAGVLVARGDGPERSPMIIGYLVTSVVALPAVALYAKKGGTRWDSLALGLTALVVAVVIGRLGVSWNEAS